MNKKHMWLMIAGCLIPLAGLAAVYLFKVQVSTVLLVGMLLFCPLSHLLMLGFMRHEHAPDRATHPHMEMTHGRK